ncbi:hypothetical protein BH23ACT12_BH23ACT12_04880 [soil metagenome]
MPVIVTVAIIGVTVVGAILAIALDLSSEFVIGDAQRGDLGIEVIWQGSAVSAPLPPIIGIVVGALLAMRTGVARLIGLVLLMLAGLMMVVGVVGEFTSDTSFTGLRQVLFVIFNATYGVLAASLAVTSLRAIFDRPARA